MKKKILFLFLSLLALTGTALAAQLTEQEAGNAGASVTIDGTTAYYETFSEAWTAATDPNVNTSAADAVITLLKDAADESAGYDFSPCQGDPGQTVTLNLSGHTLTLSSRQFFINSGTTLIINGAPENGGANGKIIRTATDGEPGVVGIGSGYDSDPIGYLQVNRCDLESHNGPAVFGGDGNVEISGCIITAQSEAPDLSRHAAVALGPNQGKETTLIITSSTLKGQCGLSIWRGLTATVEDSDILGTGEDTFDYGVWVDGGSLTVKGDTTIESPATGVNITGGRLDFQNGVIKAAAGSYWKASGLLLENNTSDDTLPPCEAVLRGTIESEKYGVYVAEGTVSIQESADITGKSEGVYLVGGQVLISGGSVTASGVDENGNPTGIGLSALGGSAGISGDPVITGATCGITLSEDAALTVTGGTIQAAGDYDGGIGLRMYGGGAALSGGTYIGDGGAVEINASGVVLRDLLADGFAYYREDGSIITAGELEEMRTWFPDIPRVTVKEGSLSGSAPEVPVSSVSQTGNSTVVRTDPAALAAILPSSGELPVIFAAIAGGGLAAASGEVNAVSGEIAFQAKLNPQDKIFFLDPDTLIPLAKASTVAAP